LRMRQAGGFAPPAKPALQEFAIGHFQ